MVKGIASFSADDADKASVRVLISLKEPPVLDRVVGCLNRADRRLGRRKLAQKATRGTIDKGVDSGVVLLEKPPLDRLVEHGIRPVCGTYVSKLVAVQELARPAVLDEDPTWAWGWDSVQEPLLLIAAMRLPNLFWSRQSWLRLVVVVRWSKAKARVPFAEEVAERSRTQIVDFTRSRYVREHINRVKDQSCLLPPSTLHSTVESLESS